MAVDEKLLEKARRGPANLDFDDLMKLAQQLGFVLRNVKGSHHVFTHPQSKDTNERYPRPLNLQRGKSKKAKPEQVKDTLNRAEAMGILGGENNDSK